MLHFAITKLDKKHETFIYYEQWKQFVWTYYNISKLQPYLEVQYG